jgi:hypothetical protein
LQLATCRLLRNKVDATLHARNEELIRPECHDAGTAVFRMIVSKDSMKNATATSQGKRRLKDAEGLAAAD